MIKNFIDILRELDENIDFARGVIQWQIVIFLSSKGPSSTAEIARGIGVNKKSVIDSVRKLVNKGIVEKVKYDIYNLSSEGKDLILKLKEIQLEDKKVEKDVVVEDILNNVTHYYYFVEIVKAAMINDGKVPISSLCNELGISKRTLINYLDIFTLKYKYFKKITKKGLLKNRNEWILTDEGRKIAYKIPGIYKMKANVFFRFLTRITKSTTLNSSLFKLMIIFSLTAPIVFSLSDSQYYRLIASIWLYFLMFFGISGLIAYLSIRF
jgi:predicted transcriptional regulator